MSPAAKAPPDGPEPDLFSPADEPSNDRLLRIDGDRGLSLAEKIAAGLQRLGYRTALHRIRLRGRFPLRLLAVPVDPMPGDRAVGARILAGRLPHSGYNAPARTVRLDDPAAPPAWRDWVNGFAWLRDLAAAADRKTGAAAAELLVARWLAQYGEFDAAAWRPDLVGQRILFWTAYAPYILSSPDLVHRSAVLNALARWARHLDRAVEKMPDGLGRVTAAGGLVVAGLLIPGGEARLKRGETLFDRALDALLLPDGGVTDRSPLTQLQLLELLLFVQSAYLARGGRATAPLVAALGRLVPALKGMVMGDGGFGAWHGGAAIRPERIDHAVRLSKVMARPSRQGAFSGYQRVAAGRSVIVVDAGPPPQARAAAAAHAGTLAFELSDGPQRLVVNCGAGIGLAKPLSPELAAALRTTAAHSTLVLGDSNSTRIRPDGALGKGVEEVVANRQESEEGVWLDLAHDGYVRRFGVRHRRRLFLSADGGDLRGEDLLETVPGRRVRRRGAGAGFDVRFHLGPGVEVVPTADGQGALLRLADGIVWQVRVRGGGLALDDSVWIDHDGVARTTRQLVVSGVASGGGAGGVNWSFKRAGR
ncbi:MAG: heparinase II/III family protein [Janthinobacterium lividum]